MNAVDLSQLVLPSNSIPHRDFSDFLSFHTLPVHTPPYKTLLRGTHSSICQE